MARSSPFLAVLPLLAVFLTATPAFGQAPPPPVLVQPAPECPVSPFGDASVVQYKAGLIGDCRDDVTRWHVEAPKVKPTDAGPSIMKAEFSSLSTWRFPSLLGTMRFDWSGLRGDEIVTSQRTMFSLGGLVKLHDTLAVQTNFGVERTAIQRSRATISSVWRPFSFGTLFAEWAGSEVGTEAHRVGGRLWIVPRRLAVDLTARQPEGQGWVDRRVGLALNLPL